MSWGVRSQSAWAENGEKGGKEGKKQTYSRKGRGSWKSGV